MTDVTTQINSLISQFTGIFKNGAAIIDSTSKSLTGQINSTINDLFGNKTNTTITKTNTPVPDPIAANFSKSTPKSNVFTTNTTLGSRVTTNVANSTTLTGNVYAVTQRYNAASGISSNSLYSSITNGLKNSTIGGYLAGTGSIITSAATAATTVSSTVTATNQAIANAQSEYNRLTNNLSTALTGSSSGLLGTLNTALGVSTTSVNGTSISSLSGISNSVITEMLQLSEKLGCKSTTSTTSTAYAATQSAFNTLLSLSANLNLTSMLSELMGCSKFDSSSLSTVKGLFNTTGVVNPMVGSTIATQLPYSQLYLSSDDIKKTVTQSTVTASEDIYIKNILEKVQKENASPYYSFNDTTDTTTYDLSTLANSDSDLITSLTGKEHLAQYAVLSN